MATITIDLPDTVSVTAFEAQVSSMARALGLKPQYAGNRKIKLVQANPNAVDQKVRRHLQAVPTLRTLANGSMVSAAALSLPVMDREAMRLVPSMPGSVDFEGPGAA